MDNQYKINEFIKLAKDNELYDICFKLTKFMNKPYYEIHYKFKKYKGRFDVSYNSFAKVSNETIIKEILRGYKFYG